MKAAIVRAAGQAPVYGDFAEPTPAPGENRITVTGGRAQPARQGARRRRALQRFGRVSRRRRR